MGYYLGTSVNNGGTWVVPFRISVNDGGSLIAIKQISINDNGTWRSVYEFYPAIADDTTYSATATYTARSGNGAYSTGYFRWVNTTDATFTSKGWWTRVVTYQYDGPVGPVDSGWVAGSASATANQASGKMWLPTKSGTGNSGLISVPTLQAQGTNFGNTWYARWCYSGEVTTFNNSLNSVPADWIV